MTEELGRTKIERDGKKFYPRLYVAAKRKTSASQKIGTGKTGTKMVTAFNNIAETYKNYQYADMCLAAYILAVKRMDEAMAAR